MINTYLAIENNGSDCALYATESDTTDINKMSTIGYFDIQHIDYDKLEYVKGFDYFDLYRIKAWKHENILREED